MILLIICYVIFWNFTYIENMYFLESSIMALSVLFYTMSAISLVEKNKYSFLKALMFAILGIISYQGTIGFLFILTALLTFIKNPKNYKANIVDIVKSGLIAGMAVIVDFAIVAIVENLIGTKQTRLSDFTRIFLNIKIILRNTKEIHIRFADGTTKQASMKKKDESLGFAIYAVAKSSIGQSTWQQISIATLGSSGSVQKGDAAVVLGKPFGYAGAVGFGTIASSRNELDGDDGSYPLLCTDIGAAEDGTGVIVNLSGEVVGIIDQSISDNSSKRLVFQV